MYSTSTRAINRLLSRNPPLHVNFARDSFQWTECRDAQPQIKKDLIAHTVHLLPLSISWRVTNVQDRRYKLGCESTTAGVDIMKPVESHQLSQLSHRCPSTKIDSLGCMNRSQNGTPVWAPDTQFHSSVEWKYKSEG